MTAVVHHGGAGTTAEGLRAGVPSVIVPYLSVTISIDHDIVDGAPAARFARHLKN